jgi:adsorption protein A
VRGWLGGGSIARIAVLVMVAAASFASRTADAQPAPKASPAAAPSYTDMLHVDRAGESFAARQVREAKTYPYLDRANRLLAQGRKDEARNELAAYLERDPDDVKVRYEYGVLLASLGDPAGAAREMTRLLELRPGFGPALLYRANARLQTGDDQGALADFQNAARHGDLAPADRTAALDAAVNVAITLGQRDLALRLLDQLQSASPDASRDLLHAQLLADAGKSDQAMSLLSRVAAGGGSQAQRRDALLRLSVIATASGKLAEARAAGEQALALDPDDAALLRRLAEIATKQGDDAAAVQYLSRSAKLAPSSDTSRAEVYAAERTGDDARAADLLRGLVAADTTGSPATVQDRTSLAVIEARQGKHAAAADAYLQAFDASRGAQPNLLVSAAVERAAAGDRNAAADAYLQAFDASRGARPDLLVSAARERAAAGDRSAAIVLYDRALDLRTLPPTERARLAEERGTLQLALGRRDAALASFDLARTLGRDGFAVEQTRGDLLLEDGNAAGALAAFRSAWRKRPEARSALGAGYSYAKLGKPGLAVGEMDRALDATPKLSPGAQRSALATLGYLHAQLDQHRLAADAWQKAQALSLDPTLVVPLAREQRLAGDVDAAQATLGTLDPLSLPSDAQAAWLDERSAIERTQAALFTGTDAESKDRRDALLRASARDLEQALALDASPDREYRLGLIYVDLDEPERAITPLERSLASGPFVPEHAATLGYAYQDLGRYDDAGRELERSLGADRDQLPLYEDLAYVRVKQFRNDDAITLLEQAIDNTPLYPVHDEAERAAVDERRLAMRREISELSRTFSLVAYSSICFGNQNCEVGATPLSAGASKSQGGVELAYRPPVIGYRDGRTFEIISRTLFEQEVNSVEPRGQTTVVTLGVRYKPISFIDGYLSAERIFGVGSQAQNNVLLRGTLGWQQGYAMQPGVPHWWYTTLYGDVARTMAGPHDWFFYGEGRQGMTFNVYGDRAMVTPHVYARGRFQTGDGEDFQEVDLGLGVVLRYLFRADEYHDYQSSVELLPRIGHDVYNSDGSDLTLSLTAIVRF